MTWGTTDRGAIILKNAFRTDITRAMVGQPFMPISANPLSDGPTQQLHGALGAAYRDDWDFAEALANYLPPWLGPRRR